MEAIQDIRDMVERVVTEVLEGRLSEIRHAVAERVEGELQPLLVQRDGATALLNVSINAIQASVTQADILNAVLDGSSNFAGRAILFIIRGASAGAWNSRGFGAEAEEALDGFSASADSGPFADAISQRKMQTVSAVAMFPLVMQKAGQPSVSEAVLLPFAVRDKVPAVLYADSGVAGNLTRDGKGRHFDPSALQLLMRAAGLWLEVVAARRAQAPANQATNQAAAAVTATHSSPAPAARPTPGQAAIQPGERLGEGPVPAKDVPHPEPPVLPAERVVESAESAQNAAAEASKEASVQRQPPEVSVEAITDSEVHKRARRFAKLLVDEIKLYNQQKVAEGREKGDLMERLRDDIEKSRAAYDKRYGASDAARADYFNQELVRNLAADDAALLGPSFQR